jgi:HAD superfamily hydrolase (TIGR01484 family)
MADRPPVALDRLPADAAAGVRGVLTDIDDTLTTAGAITNDALGALHALRDSGLRVIAITGRPMGWSEPFARDWPVDAVVAENGGVALFRDRGSVRIEYAQDAATRELNARRLQAARARVLREVPAATLARDSAGRRTDIAIDHAEFARLSADEIEKVVYLLRSEGLQATVSSIHVNGWIGEHDKWSGARWMVRRLFDEDLDATFAHWMYVGDSTNDQVMFARLPLSVGVANLMHFAGELHTWPAYIAAAARGAGFAEIVAHLLRARAA